MYDQRIHYSVKHYTSMVFFLIVKATSTTLRQTVLHNDPVASQDHYARFRIRTRDLCFCRLVGLIGVISMCHSLFVENIRTADVKTAFLYTLLRKRTYVICGIFVSEDCLPMYSTPKKATRQISYTKNIMFFCKDGKIQ